MEKVGKKIYPEYYRDIKSMNLEMKNIKKIELIKWTTQWAFDNLDFEKMPLFNSKQKLDESPNRFQLGFKSIKVKIIMKKIK